MNDYGPKMTRRLIVALLALVCMSPDAGAQILNRPTLRREITPAVDHIYNLNHVEAADLLNELHGKYPADPAIPLLRALNQFWQAELSRKDIGTHPYILEQLEEALDKNGAFEGDPAARESFHFVEFMAYALEARLWYFEEEDWSAVNAARKVLDHLDPVIDMAEGSPELSLIAGLYHYYAVTYPREKTYLKPFMAFFPAGSVEKGMQELRVAASEANVGQAQALYYLTDIYLYEEENAEKAIRVSKRLHQLFPGNTWFHADYIRALMHDGQFAEAETACRTILDQFYQLADNNDRVITSQESPYTTQVMMRIYHYLGQIAYHQDEDAATAKDWFWDSRKMIRLSGMDRDKYAAYNAYYLGLCEDRLGDRKAAIHYYKLALDHPDNSDIEAQAELCLESSCGG